MTRSGRSAVPDDLRRDGARRSPPAWDHTAIAAHAEDYRTEALDEQRRLFYVAVTRARESVLVTRSTWTWTAEGGPKKAAAKSSYFTALAAAGHVVHEVGGPPPDANPLPPLVLFDSPTRSTPSPLELAVVAGTPVADAPTTPRIDAVVATAAALLERRARERSVPPAPPTEHTVTDLVLVARCPVAYARRRVLGLPQAPSEAARRGTLVHRWLEERAWALQEGNDPALVPRPWQAAALLPLLPASAAPARATLDPDAGADAPADDPPEPIGSDAEADRLADRFERSRYADRVPEAAELPLVLSVGGAFVRGTADLLYADAPDGGGGWEVVDLKTGPAPADDAGWLQLEAYALAVADDERPLADATLSFLSLGGRQARATTRRPRSRDAILGDLRAAVASTSGPYTCVGCRWCR